MFVQDVLAPGKHLPGLVDLVFAVEVDAGVSIDLTDLIGTAETLSTLW